VAFAPTASSALAALPITILGSGTTDALAVSLGANATGVTGAITALGFETLTISSAAASTVPMSITNILMDDAAGSQTVTVTGAGNFTLGQVRADTLTTTGVTGTVSATLTNGTGGSVFSGGSGATTITGTGLADQITTGLANDIIDGGVGADRIDAGNGTNTITGGQGADVMTGGTGVDTYNQTIGTAYIAAQTDRITNFTAGASGDILQISLANADAAAATGILAAGDGQTIVAGNLVVKTMTAGTGITLDAADEVVVISGTLADAAALIASIGTTGIITKSAANTTTNALLVVWSDGVDTHVSLVSDAGADAAMTSAQLTVIDIAVLTGVLTGFNTINFAAVT
jgi:Ca2+-binding RTX toxin-like protein